MSEAWSSSAQQTGACDVCSRGIFIQFSQVADAGDLSWSWRAACESCKKTIGHEGVGVTPAEIRAAILVAEGEWTLTFAEPAGVAIRTIKAIRSVFKLGLAEAKGRWDAAAGTGLRGTRAECEALLVRLREDGVECAAAFAGAEAPLTPVLPPGIPLPSQGDWSIAISGGAKNPIGAIKSIRAAFGCGLKEAKELWDSRGAGHVIRGTRLQMEALSARLQAEGLEHQIGSARGQA